MENLLFFDFVSLQEYYFRDFFSLLFNNYNNLLFNTYTKNIIILLKYIIILIIIYRAFFFIIFLIFLFLFSKYYYKNIPWYHEDKKFFYPISFLHFIIFNFLIILNIIILFFQHYHDLFVHNFGILFYCHSNEIDMNPKWPLVYQWLWASPYLNFFFDFDNYIYNLELVWTTLFLIDILLILILLPIFIYATILPFLVKLLEIMIMKKKFFFHYFSKPYNILKYIDYYFKGYYYVWKQTNSNNNNSNSNYNAYKNINIFIGIISILFTLYILYYLIIVYNINISDILVSLPEEIILEPLTNLTTENPEKRSIYYFWLTFREMILAWKWWPRN